MYEDENNLYHYSYRKGDEQNPNAPIDTKNYAEGLLPSTFRVWSPPLPSALTAG